MICFVQEVIHIEGTLRYCLDNNKIIIELKSGISRENCKIKRERKCAFCQSGFIIY